MKKKLVIVLVIFVMAIGSASALDFMNAAEGVKDSGFLINVGVGFGTLSPYDMIVPPVGISVEYMLPIDLPISVGGFFDFAMYGSGNKDTFAGYYQDMPMVFGLKGSWHVDFGVPNLDIYASVVLGYMIWERSREYTFIGPQTQKFNMSAVYFGTHLGGRYFFTDNIGAYAELGYSALTFARIGLALKF
ncbi:MAG: hypothetical protein FWD28_10905 [Treponema sp.]|nr:hypothetical protein [Treponema sp.]